MSESKPQNLPYEDFAKLDIRVGVITKAEAVPKKDRLLRLEVDFAETEGPRVIVAGIAENYNPEGLVGLSIVAVLNLAPRKLAGIESHGMLLAGHSVTGAISLVGANTIAKGGAVG